MADLDTGRRFVIADGAPLFREPGRSGFAKLARGQAVRLVRDEQGGWEREGDFVRVQPVDANGRPSGSPGWISGSQIGTGRPGGVRVQWRGQQLATSSAGQRILAGAVPCESGYCAVTVKRALGISESGHAYQMPDILRRNGFAEAGAGQPRPGDVLVWEHYGSNQRSRGYRYGHVGILALGADGTPLVISNFEGNRDVRRLESMPGGFRVFRSGR